MRKWRRRCEAMQTDCRMRMQAILLRIESWVDSVKEQLRRLFEEFEWVGDFGQFRGAGQAIANSLMCP